MSSLIVFVMGLSTQGTWPLRRPTLSDEFNGDCHFCTRCLSDKFQLVDFERARGEIRSISRTRESSMIRIYSRIHPQGFSLILLNHPLALLILSPALHQISLSLHIPIP